MKRIKIGMIGCGNVGSGVLKWLQENRSLIAARTGIHLEIAGIAVADLGKDRGVTIDPEILTDDADSLIADPEIDVVVELVGGMTAAKAYVEHAIEQGKPVVTANKALLAYHGKALFAAAARNNTDIYYEASVGGGIPVIKSLREGLAGNHITKIYGILNGTCNYILTRMETDGADFGEVLEDAQRLGYAESDPALDINGGDTAHKTCIIASLAYGAWFGMDSIHVEGITDIELQDIRNAAEAGYKIKLLGIIKHNSDGIELRVHPTLIPATSMLAKVDGVYNAMLVHGDVVGETMYYGPGAGGDATASAVIADLVDVALNLKHDSSNRIAGFRAHELYDDVVAMEHTVSRYYIRLSVNDQPSALAGIAHILGDHEISIASVIQKESESEKLPVILITHDARELDINQALERIQDLPVVHGKPVLLRIEDL